jgi:Cdc6-like AAA superfamily ATPase
MSTNCYDPRSLVVDYFSANPHQVGNVGVACVYLTHKESEDHTPAKLLAGLWRQLLLGKTVGSRAKELYQQHCNKGTSPSTQEVFEVLRQSLTKFSRAYIIVDAVDEYPETKRNILFGYLRKMGSTVNLMITCRPHIMAHSCFPNAFSLEIHASEDDIRRYVDAQIQMSSRLSRHVRFSPELQEEIHCNIMHTVDGM